MTVVLTIVLTIGVNYLLGHWYEIVSSNRSTPKGYEHDWDQSNYDITMHGKAYYHRKNAHGGYDKKIEDKK